MMGQAQAHAPVTPSSQMHLTLAFLHPTILQRPYTLSMIEKALRDSHFSVNPAKPAKQQALKAVALLQKTIPIERAHMTVRVTLPTGGE